MEMDNYKLEQTKTHKETALFWIKLANERNGYLTRQLLTLAGLLLPIFPTLLDESSLNDVTKTLVLFVLIFLLFSIVSGLIQLIIDSKYFALLSNDSSLRESKWNSNQNIEQIKAQINTIPITNPRGTACGLQFQAVFLLISFVIIVILFGIVLFQPNYK